MTAERTGVCRCGQVRLTVRGVPNRIGLCHCTDCRKESGSAFTYFAVWPISQFETTGATAEHRGRQFCSCCGSRLFSLEAGEAEVKLGILSEAPARLLPSYELWVKRREPWLKPVDGADQHDENRR